jgi:hypothetical protein
MSAPPAAQRVRDFWRHSGFHLLGRDATGRLAVSDDFLRAYYLRPEIHPVEESCDAERALHAALMQSPRREVSEGEIDAMRDADVRDNYRILLRFRRRLLDAGTVERCYMDLFKGSVDIPPLFVDQMANVILRNVLADCDDPLQLRAAELFFREQKIALVDGHPMLADTEVLEMRAARGGAESSALGRLIAEAQGSLGSQELDVLDRANAALYWERESRFDTAISLSYGGASLEALSRVIEAWVAHFLGVRSSVKPLRRIEERRWAWHVGLDAESSASLNEIWGSGEFDEARMRRIVALWRMDFADPADMRADLAGRPVYLALSANGDNLVRMKPQNLLVNLPLAARAS